MHRTLSILALGALVSCASKPKTSVLTADDLEVTTTAMAQKLQASEFLADRTPQSPPVVIAISKVENLSSDLIPESEEWWLMDRVRGSLPIVDLGKARNVRFVIPIEQLRKARREGTIPLDAVAERRPTHEMSATFRSGTRSAGKDRTDAYLVEYRITNLDTGAMEWTGTFEFKRTAFGKAYD